MICRNGALFRWIKKNVTSVGASTHYVFVIYDGKSMFYQSTGSTFPESDWRQTTTETPASQMAVSSSGKQLLRLYEGTAYQGLKAKLYSPELEARELWNALEKDVSSIGIVQLDITDDMGNYIWMLHTNGSMTCRLIASPKNIFYLEVPVTVKKLCCQNDLVFILLTDGALYRRSRLSFESPMGIGWERQDAPGELITMALSPSRHLWALSQSKEMYLLHYRAFGGKGDWQTAVLPVEFQFETPNWLKFSVTLREIPNFDLTVTGSRIFLATIGTSFLLTAQNKFGYAWNKLSWTILNDCGWKTVNVNGFSDKENYGIFGMLNHKNELFYGFRHGAFLENVSLPTKCPIQNISVSGKRVCLLTIDGKSFIIDVHSNPEMKSRWVELSTVEFQADTKLCFMSLGAELAWACDQQGKIHFRFLDKDTSTLVSSAWIAIHGPTIHFKEIHVASSSIVCALDKEGNIYFRNGVSTESPMGTQWVVVTDIKASQLAASTSAVLALTRDGSIYRRGGITQQNCSGDSWENIPGLFTYISVTPDDSLWSLDSKGAVYQLAMFPSLPKLRTIAGPVSTDSAGPGSADSAGPGSADFAGQGSTSVSITVKVDQVLPKSINVNWTLNGATDMMKYVADIKPSPEIPNEVYRGNGNNYTFKNLLPCTDYTITVTGWINDQKVAEGSANIRTHGKNHFKNRRKVANKNAKKPS